MSSIPETAYGIKLVFFGIEGGSGISGSSMAYVCVSWLRLPVPPKMGSGFGGLHGIIPQNGHDSNLGEVWKGLEY